MVGHSLSKGQSFCHFEMSRPAYHRSVIRSDNHHAGLIIYHFEAFIIEHIEKNIIFSCAAMKLSTADILRRIPAT